MKYFLVLLILLTFSVVLFAQTEGVEPKATFIELGSVNCIPCKQMQPVMKSIEEKYGEQVKVIFYDVWKQEQKKYAQQYGIRLIPTQVFLDENGKEFHRHEGFYPEAEIDKILKAKGLKPEDKKS
jgi:thioredoxin 1